MLFTTHYSAAKKSDMLFRQPVLTFVYFKGQTIWESPFKDQQSHDPSLNNTIIEQDGLIPPPPQNTLPFIPFEQEAECNKQEDVLQEVMNQLTLRGGDGDTRAVRMSTSVSAVVPDSCVCPSPQHQSP